MVSDSIEKAIMRNHPEAIKSLAENITDINQIKVFGKSLLFFAVSLGFAECAEALREVGASWNPNEVDTIIKKAFECDIPGMIKALASSGVDLKGTEPSANNRSYIHEAVDDEKLGVLKALIDVGVNIDKKKHGTTALHMAVLKDRLASARVLIARGADVDCKGTYGFTPLHFARSKEMVEVLCHAGADAAIVNKFNRTPLQQALIQHKTEVVDTLIRLGAEE